MDSSESPIPPEPRAPATKAAEAGETATTTRAEADASQDAVSSPAAAGSPGRVCPGTLSSLWLLAKSDLAAISHSWLARGLLVASVLLTVLQLKGMQAEQKVASQMLEAVYAVYLLIWMHGVIFLAGSALSREQDCLSDAILSRGVTRLEYLGGKLVARWLAVLLIIGGVLLPASFWAIRQDTLVRTETGFIASNARNTVVEAWDPKKVFAAVPGAITQLSVELGDAVHAGDIVAVIEDRQLFDQLETDRRAEETARGEAANTRRRFEDAQRAVAQANDELVRAERALVAKDLISRMEQADRETELRSRKRALKTAENQLRMARDAITNAQRTIENAQARVRLAREQLGHATITAPLSGYVTELHIQTAQQVSVGTHLLTLAPLDDYQLRVPVYRFEEFKRLKPGLEAYVTIEDTEFKGTIERLGATTRPDRWGRASNFAVVRFRGNGTLGLLGRQADVRLVLPPAPESASRLTGLLNTLTGSGSDDLKSRTASVTPFWMLVALGKVLGCAVLLVAFSLFAATLFRNALVTILTVTGCWHISNLVFDFAGLPDLSYLEMLRTMDKVLGGIANPTAELTTLAWLLGLTLAFGAGALLLFARRDPPS